MVWSPDGTRVLGYTSCTEQLVIATVDGSEPPIPGTARRTLCLLRDRSWQLAAAVVVITRGSRALARSSLTGTPVSPGAGGAQLRAISPLASGTHDALRLGGNTSRVSVPHIQVRAVCDTVGGTMQRELVERVMRGDLEAFEGLVRASQARLHAMATLILRDAHRAEDAVQEALLEGLA